MKYIKDQKLVVTDPDLSPIYIDRHGKIVDSNDNGDMFEQTFVSLPKLKKYGNQVVSFNKLHRLNEGPEVRWVKLNCKVIKIEKV